MGVRIMAKHSYKAFPREERMNQIETILGVGEPMSAYLLAKVIGMNPSKHLYTLLREMVELGRLAVVEIQPNPKRPPKQIWTVPGREEEVKK